MLSEVALAVGGGRHARAHLQAQPVQQDGEGRGGARSHGGLGLLIAEAQAGELGMGCRDLLEELPFGEVVQPRELERQPGGMTKV